MLVLKIILLILTVILLLLLLCMFIPVSVFINYKNEFDFSVSVLGIKVFRFSKYKKSDKEKPETEEAKTEEKKENFILKVYRTKGFKNTVIFLSQLAKMVMDKLKFVLKHIKFTDIRLLLNITGSDASDTAVKYGEVCSAVYPVLSGLFSVSDCKAESIDIISDFKGSKSFFEFTVKISSLSMFLIIAGLKALFEYKKILEQNKIKIK